MYDRCIKIYSIWCSISNVQIKLNIYNVVSNTKFSIIAS